MRKMRCVFRAWRETLRKRWNDYFCGRHNLNLSHARACNIHDLWASVGVRLAQRGTGSVFHPAAACL